MFIRICFMCQIVNRVYYISLLNLHPLSRPKWPLYKCFFLVCLQTQKRWNLYYSRFFVLETVWFLEIIPTSIKTMTITSWCCQDFCFDSSWNVVVSIILINQISNHFAAIANGVQTCISMAEHQPEMEELCLQTIFNSDFFWDWYTWMCQY